MTVPARFTVYTDIDRQEQHMIELSPADAPAIHEFIQAAHRFTRFSLIDTHRPTHLTT